MTTVFTVFDPIERRRHTTRMGVGILAHYNAKAVLGDNEVSDSPEERAPFSAQKYPGRISSSFFR
jgi:hypothetical protein